MARTINKLSRQMNRQIENWLLESWEGITREGEGQKQAAAAAAIELGFPVTLGNIQGAVRALDLEWPSRRAEGQRQRHADDNLAERVESLRTDLAELRKDDLVLAVALRHLYMRLGEDQSNDLMLLWARAGG